MNAVWYSCLSVIADCQALAYWRMTNGATFWWVLTDRAQLQADRFRDQPFLFSEIGSVIIYREAITDGQSFSVDWALMKQLLESIVGLRVSQLAGVRPWPSSPPTEALGLAVMDAQQSAPADRPRQ